MIKKIVLGLVVLLIVFQFFRIDKTNPVTNPANDMFVVEKVPQEVQQIIRTSCYDCHSNQTNYPWYSNVAPVSWWVKHHINEGREELNFNEWGTYSRKRKLHKLEEIEEAASEGWMPLSSYLIMHGDARLNQQQRKKLSVWAHNLRTPSQIEEP